MEESRYMTGYYGIENVHERQVLVQDTLMKFREWGLYDWTCTLSVESQNDVVDIDFQHKLVTLYEDFVESYSYEDMKYILLKKLELIHISCDTLHNRSNTRGNTNFRKRERWIKVERDALYTEPYDDKIHVDDVSATDVLFPMKLTDDVIVDVYPADPSFREIGSIETSALRF